MTPRFELDANAILGPFREEIEGRLSSLRGLILAAEKVRSEVQERQQAVASHLEAARAGCAPAAPLPTFVRAAIDRHRAEEREADARLQPIREEETRVASALTHTARRHEGRLPTVRELAERAGARAQEARGVSARCEDVISTVADVTDGAAALTDRLRALARRQG